METQPLLEEPACLYLYGIVGAGPVELTALQGIESRGDVSVVSAGGLACAVSPVPLSQYGEQAMTGHAQDLDWIAPRAVRHQEVIQHLMQAGPVIPFKFGVLCSGPAKVQELLEQHDRALLELLDFLRGRQEWAVKVYLDEALASHALEETAAEAAALNQAISAAAAGAAYFLRKKKKRLVDEHMERLLSGLGEQVYQRLLTAAVQGSKSRFLNPSAEPGRRPLLSAALLVEEGKLPRLHSALQQLEQDYRSYGLSIELGGPWAPYSFCGDLTQRCGG